MKEIGVNKWETDSGHVISGQERDYITFDEGTKSVRLPVETIVSKDGRYGSAIVFGKYLKWSDGSLLAPDDIKSIKADISSVFNLTGYYYKFEP